MDIPARVIERFWANLDTTSTPDGHWLWRLSLNSSGYGKLAWTDDPGQHHAIGTHRLSYIIHHGPVPDGLLVCHKPPCVIRHCCQPGHLYAGTQRQNTQDCIAVGHQYTFDTRGSRHGQTHLREEDVLEIRELRGKVPPQEICDRFNIRPRTRREIQSGRSWQSLSGEILPARWPHGNMHYNTRLSDATVAEIRARFTGKFGEQTMLAKEYGVSIQHIHSIVHRRKRL